MNVCYLKDTFLKTYYNILSPVNGKDLWESNGNDHVLPPNYTRQPGRPKNGRNKKNDEKKSIDARNSSTRLTKT